MKISQLLTGVIAILLGLFLILLSIFVKGAIPALIYGIPIFIIGFFILLNTNEDKIEQIKNKKHNGGKK